jgi:hypothetical protein
MKRNLTLLSIVLALQLALAGLVWSTQAAPPAASHAPLLPDVDKATEITLVDPDDGSLTLRRVDGQWQLDDGQKADADTVAQLLDRLAALKESFPVARTEDARARFKVADDHFRRKVILRDGDRPLATLLVGSAPAMGESHVRLADTDPIYRVALPVYDLPVTADHWRAREPKPAEAADTDTGEAEDPPAQAGAASQNSPEGE